jgi:hypothetical protein
MGEVLEALVMIFMFGLITSPQYFFSKVDAHILNQPKEKTQISHVNVLTTITTCSEEKMVLDEKRLSALDGIIATCQNPNAKRIWEIKKAEYLRQVKWNRLVEMSGASERIKGL